MSLTDSSSDTGSPASPRDPGEADHYGLEGEAEVVRERARPLPRRALLLVAAAILAAVVAAALRCGRGGHPRHRCAAVTGQRLRGGSSSSSRRRSRVGDYITLSSGALGGRYDGYLRDISLAYLTLQTGNGRMSFASNVVMTAAGGAAPAARSGPGG
jgi:hypothetical protein